MKSASAGSGRAAAEGRDIVLVGDAEAFFYLVPMRLLHYKTVFDVPAGETDPLHAWGGTNADSLLIINAEEIDRLHRTYWDMPALPESWGLPREEPVIVEGGELRPGPGK